MDPVVEIDAHGDSEISDLILEAVAEEREAEDLVFCLCFCRLQDTGSKVVEFSYPAVIQVSLRNPRSSAPLFSSAAPRAEQHHVWGALLVLVVVLPWTRDCRSRGAGPLFPSCLSWLCM